MVAHMVNGDKPLAYVLGTQPFHPLVLPLLVRPPTLIPRPETEHWVSHLASRILTSSSPPLSSAPTAPPFRLLDIGTGSGCIALALAAHLRSADRAVQSTAVDRAPTALALATENAARQSLSDVVAVREADLFSPSFAAALTDGDGFDLVVSNPPYITRAEYAELDPSVRAWEDRGALVGEGEERGDGRARAQGAAAADDDDGLVFYRRIVSLLDELLAARSRAPRSAPVVAFEVGQGQARAVERLLQDWRAAGCAKLETDVVRDPWGIERAVFARWRDE
ncbi:hypothetical protein JCM3775_001602 [Rhodotorula graminis]